MTQRVTYVLDDLVDEGSGFHGELDRIARDLSDPDLRVQASGGQTFKATQIVYLYEPCPRGDDGIYVVPRWTGEIHALAYGDGEGWSPDFIIGWSEAELNRMRDLRWNCENLTGEAKRADEMAEAQRLLQEFGTDPVEYLACIVSEVTGTITFHRDGGAVRCTWSEDAA